MKLLLCDDQHERLFVTRVSTRQELDQLFIELRGEIAEHGAIFVELWRIKSQEEQEAYYEQAKQAYTASQQGKKEKAHCS